MSPEQVVTAFRLSGAFMASKKKSRAELAVELRLLKSQRLGMSAASVINNLIRWTGVVLVVYFIQKSIASLSGQTTYADIGLKLIGDVRLSDVFAALFGGGGVVYGLKQRSLRRDTVERLQGRIKQLEKAIDQRRSSSNLTPRGQTSPEDL